nr:MAG TPA: hypothetical protein [Caudoviricetes sp.]
MLKNRIENVRRSSYQLRNVFFIAIFYSEVCYGKRKQFIGGQSA